MGKRKWSIILAIFFLLSDVLSASVSSAINYPLTQIKVDPSSPDKSFKKIYDSICFGLSIYRLDVIERYSKEALIEDAGKIALSPGISFDLENIDIIKKGWTRYCY